MNNDNARRIRRAAILVASLDETLAEQMLAGLPPLVASKVLAELDGLEEIDPQEQEDVLAEFRSVTRRSRSSEEGVQFTYSAPAPRERQPEESDPAKSGGQATSPDEAAPIAEAEAKAMAELLGSEHPQIIAAALSRLGHEQGAAVFAALPQDLQPEVLDRIATLDAADEDALLEVHSQLQQRIEQHRQRRHQAAAGAELARRIVARTPPADQHVLLARLSMDERAPAPASATGSTRAEPFHRLDGRQPAPVARRTDPVAQQALNLASAVQHAKQHAALGTDSCVTDSAAAPAEVEDLSAALEALSDAALLRALQRADQQMVHRALAASSDAFLRRVTSKLTWRQARSLRRDLRAMAPTRLADLRHAQSELLQLASVDSAALAVS